MSTDRNEDRLRAELVGTFTRMRLHYGAEWAGKWAGIELGDMLAEWAQVLAGIRGSQEHVAAVLAEAMRVLPERPPNAQVFRRLCVEAQDRMRVPAGPGRQLPVRGPTPEERASLQQLRDSIACGTLFARPGPEWAQRIVDSHARGEQVGFAALRLAREVVEAQARRNAPATVTGHDIPDYWEPPLSTDHRRTA